MIVFFSLTWCYDCQTCTKKKVVAENKWGARVPLCTSPASAPVHYSDYKLKYRKCCWVLSVVECYELTVPCFFYCCNTVPIKSSIHMHCVYINKGVRIDGEHLSHLIFADDIVLIANSTSKLQDMLQDIHDISKPVGLTMHLGKTKIMCNKHVNKDDVIVDGKKIEEVDSYVYLGQMVTKDHDQIQEMKRRIGQGWSAFCKPDNIMRDKNVPMRLKRKVFNECILPVMTYGCETWSLSNTQLEKLVTTQRKMERIMIGVTLKDRKSTEWIRKQSGLTDIIRSIRESKHRWAGHVARRRDNRLTIRITEWIPHGNKRPRGRPRTRWCDDLIQYVGPTWSHIARDRKLWQACREGFLLRERETPWVMCIHQTNCKSLTHADILLLYTNCTLSKLPQQRTALGQIAPYSKPKE